MSTEIVKQGGALAIRPDQTEVQFGDARLPKRFWQKVRIADGGCWEWTANRLAGGYGTYKHAGRTQLAHRVSYLALAGSTTNDLVLDHLCRVRHCVNPAHLEPVTTRENLLRGETFQAANATKTHCPQGHPYDEANTYPIPNGGGRGCRACRRAADRRFRARNIGQKGLRQ